MWNPVDITSLAVAVVGALAAGAVAVISAWRGRVALAAHLATSHRAPAPALADPWPPSNPFATPGISTITDGIDPTGGGPSSAPPSNLRGVSPRVLARMFLHRGAGLVVTVKSCSAGAVALGAGPRHEPVIEDDR